MKEFQQKIPIIYSPLGVSLGISEGSSEGREPDGTIEGLKDGTSLGTDDGWKLGRSEGTSVDIVVKKRNKISELVKVNKTNKL